MIFTIHVKDECSMVTCTSVGTCCSIALLFNTNDRGEREQAIKLSWLHVVL